MKWFLNLTTRNKLFLGFGLKLALMAWVIASAYTGACTSWGKGSSNWWRSTRCDGKLNSNIRTQEET